jgi:hypothetical protein
MAEALVSAFHVDALYNVSGTAAVDTFIKEHVEDLGAVRKASSASPIHHSLFTIHNSDPFLTPDFCLSNPKRRKRDMKGDCTPHCTCTSRFYGCWSKRHFFSVCFRVSGGSSLAHWSHRFSAASLTFFEFANAAQAATRMPNIARM